MVLSGSEFMFEIGTVLIIAFAGAILAAKLKQSLILGYMVAGILIGPFISIQIAGLSYNGIVQDRGFIDAMSQIGMILLLFFVGLEFSIDKIKRIKGPAALLSVVEVGVSLFTGFLLAAFLGWPLLDAVFLSAVLAMSCSAVAMKALMDLGRLERPETELMLGMIIMEEFISMVFLTVVGGLMVKVGTDFTLTSMVIGMVAFFGFFVVLAILVIPRLVRLMQRIKSEELLVLLALAIVCLSSAFAEICGVPPLIGAFFIGMVFAGTKIVPQIEKTVAPIRDVFVAVFFVSFGMLIDLSQFGQVFGIVLIAVVLILVDEVLIMSTVAYLIGFSRRSALAVGSSFTARGGESVLYASVGSQSVGVTKGAELYPIAGAVTFIMSTLCPILIKNSNRLADGLARRLPRPMTYASALVSRTLGRSMLRQVYRTRRISRWFYTALVAYLGLVVVLAGTSGYEHMLLFALTIIITALLWRLMSSEIATLAIGVDYSGIGAGAGSNERIGRFVVTLLGLSMIATATVSFMFQINWLSVIAVVVGYLAVVVVLMGRIFHSTSRSGRALAAGADL